MHQKTVNKENKMPDNSSLYLVINAFLDRNGNSYQARNEPYKYGELPAYIRDDTRFCIPVETVEVITEVLTPDKAEKINENQDTKPLEFKAKQVKTTYIKKEVK
jgi:ABC-type sulfate transport system substrate-binding protein